MMVCGQGGDLGVWYRARVPRDTLTSSSNGPGVSQGFGSGILGRLRGDEKRTYGKIWSLVV